MVVSDALLGQGLALASAFCFAFANVLIARSSGRRDSRGVVFSVLVTAVFAAVIWLATESLDMQAVASTSWWKGVALYALAGVLSMVVGRSFLYTSVRRLGVVRSSTVKRMNPFFSSLLAFLILGEVITMVGAAGMAVLLFAFLLMMRESAKNQQVGDDAPPPVWDYSFGVLSALAYGSAYIFRKFGIFELPYPAFGTFVSALAGLVAFLLAGLFVKSLRGRLTGIFTDLDRWMIMASIAVSLGQILFFAAIVYETVIVVVMIASLEIFIASYLSIFVFRLERKMSFSMVFASIFAFTGVILITLG
ncbi:MAG: DMT family transporter [Alphaproteobacteria bacterium]|nr:DMT family transporter [Alphaproteobacteria bacterium]